MVKLIFIDIDSIVMLERQQNKTIIYCTAEKYISSESLQSLKEKLISPDFYHSHKSFIINTKYINQIYPIGNRTYEVLFSQSNNSALVSRSKINNLYSLLNVP